MTTDPVEPQEPRKPRKPGDPFERAAKREEQEELRREMTRAKMLSKVTGKDSEMGGVLAGIAFPWVVWGLIRAASYHFGSPTVPQSLVRFFFGDFWWYGALTVTVLLTMWGALVSRFSGDDD